MTEEYFPKKTELRPKIYAYTDTNFPGCLKVGYTARTVEERMKEHYPTKTPYKPYNVVFEENAMRSDGTTFNDHDVHRKLKSMNIPNTGGEWYKCKIKDVKSALIAVRDRTENIENRTEDFKMRPEQSNAVDSTIKYYESIKREDPKRIPKYLWNAKMRFGKTFAAYQLAKKMGFKKVLILTFKPAVQSAWRQDLLSHIDFEGWQFISRDPNDLQNTIDIQYEKTDKEKPIVCFGSFQDFLGIDKESGGIKAKNKWVHNTDWDLVIFDEYHFGAWRQNAKKLFEQPDEDKYEEDLTDYIRGNESDETYLPIKTSHYLYLSGTPFKSINSGEFIEEQIYNWTYSDEQRAKKEWTQTHKNEENPYLELPQMILCTYEIPNSIKSIAKGGEFDEFDLNEFFYAEGEGDKAHFKHQDYVQHWLDLIRGEYRAADMDELKLGADKPPMPYSDLRLLSHLNHTLWFMPDVASCYAMKNLLRKKHNIFFNDYNINVCAGASAGIGVDALKPVQNSMIHYSKDLSKSKSPLETKTITLSCGKLTTGVTIKPWTGILMLRNLSSPETYFQAAFRVQSPWTLTTDDGKKEIIKKVCYVFDFAVNRALKQISEYSCQLNMGESNPEKKVEEFINFLPVLAYKDGRMNAVNAAEILEIAMAGTTATLLAKRWESALLVNVDNETLSRLLANEEAMAALMRIEGFRNLNEDITTIINKSAFVRDGKSSGKKLSKTEKRELTEAEKEFKTKRKMIQEKLIKFATRIPVFMYLTDYREYSLKDIITQIEPELFKKVTGLTLKDFELLVSLNVFNESIMNDAVYKFKRYEDNSLSYTGIDRHLEENKVGLYSTVISREDYLKMADLLEDSMTAAPPKDDDIPNNKSYFEDDEIE